MAVLIRIRRNAHGATITIPKDRPEPNDADKLRLIAMLVSDLGRRLDIEEFELELGDEKVDGDP